MHGEIEKLSTDRNKKSNQNILELVPNWDPKEENHNRGFCQTNKRLLNLNYWIQGFMAV